ncbi:DUF421 domain-containing protein [Corynebacterium sp. YSMAA1_1_F7]|uniref:DUF421 domain-containing protein n=1 Tax=Corynebacterium sp. YSMAA1_1_F7 TaxID=3383590 RepID=UPI0038D10AD5
MFGGLHDALSTAAISAADFTPPQGWGPVLKEQLGIDLWRIPVVVVAAIGIYLTFLVAVRLFGQRILSTLGGFDAVVIFMFGAVAGRAVLGHPPSLAAGVIGLLTLMCMEAIFGAVQDVVGLRRTINPPPTVLIAHGEVVEEMLKRNHITEAAIATAARKAGVRDLSEVACMILESNGSISTLRAGEKIDPTLLQGVEGAEKVL